MSKLVAFARTYAIAAHNAVGQTRKYTKKPYHAHPSSVANTVSRFGARDEVIAAAWLHDVLEDTQVTYEQLREFFGDEVAFLVLELTERPRKGKRAHRKRIECRRLARVSEEAQMIKLADLIDNTKDIVKYDPDFARVYLKEKAALLAVLTKPVGVFKQRAEWSLDFAWKHLAGEGGEDA